MAERKKFTDILSFNSDRQKMVDLWNRTEAAPELSPLPSGLYRCRLIDGGFDNNNRKGTLSYKITFEVIDGDHARRRIWSNHWFTDDAMEFTKRALGRLGITRMEQLDQPPPSGIVCDVRVALREDDDGTKRNRVVTFDVVGIETPRSNPFAPSSSLSPVTAGGGNSGDGAVDVAIGDDNEDDDFEGPSLTSSSGLIPRGPRPNRALAFIHAEVRAHGYAYGHTHDRDRAGDEIIAHSRAEARDCDRTEARDNARDCTRDRDLDKACDRAHPPRF